MDFIEKTKVQLGEKSGWNGGWVSTYKVFSISPLVQAAKNFLTTLILCETNCFQNVFIQFRDLRTILGVELHGYMPCTGFRPTFTTTHRTKKKLNNNNWPLKLLWTEKSPNRAAGSGAISIGRVCSWSWGVPAARSPAFKACWATSSAALRSRAIASLTKQIDPLMLNEMTFYRFQKF